MRKAIRIFSSSVLCAGVLLAGNNKISQYAPLELSVSGAKPVVLDFNFNVKRAKLILSDDGAAAIEILDRGVLFIPKKEKPSGTIVVVAKDGKNYVVNLTGTGSSTVEHIEDPAQEYERKAAEGKVAFETDQIDRDMRNITKAILLQKPLSGFKKVKASKKIGSGQFQMAREYRYVGGKYIADYWELENVTNETLYFEEREFYTKGVLGVGIQKNRVEPGEKVYLLLLLNKQKIYEDAKES